MSRSNEPSAASASGSGAQARAYSLHPKDLRDPGGERAQSNESSGKARSPLSADDIDEQIRAYFAQDLA
ncbi:MAG: hypothetical protein WB646_16915 [Steroidobacteraceae bacterium]